MSDVIEENVTQAAEAHARLSALRVWAIRQAADFRAKAEVADEIDHDDAEALPASPEELRKAADRIETVAERIEQGDATRVRNG